jgi:hypothetical protein
MPYIATNGACHDTKKICYDQAGSIRTPDFSTLNKWSVKDVQVLTEFFDQSTTQKSVPAQMAIIKKNQANMLDALQSGPIVCGVSVPEDLETWDSKKIYTNPAMKKYVHDISVVGYDQTGDIPYWIVRNSWGEPWGYGGFINVEMGKGILGIELICRSFTPVLKTDPKDVKNKVLRKAWEDSLKKESVEQRRMFKKEQEKAEQEDEQRLNFFELFFKHFKEQSFLSTHSKANKGCTKASWEDESLAPLLKNKKPYQMISDYE